MITPKEALDREYTDIWICIDDNLRTGRRKFKLGNKQNQIKEHFVDRITSDYENCGWSVVRLYCSECEVSHELLFSEAE